MDTFQSRRRFIALAENIYRELGYPPPVLTNDPAERLTLEIECGDMQFKLMHSAYRHPERVLIRCQLETEPEEKTVERLTALLRANQTLFRSREAILGIDEESGCATYIFSQLLEMARADTLLADLEAMAARRAQQWYRACFLNDMPPLPVDGAWRACFRMPVDTASEDEAQQAYRERFLASVNELHDELDVPVSISSPAEGGDNALQVTAMVYDKLHTMWHPSLAAPECLFECLVGAMPVERTEEALRRLLEMNHEMANTHATFFGVDAVSNEVVYLYTKNMEDQTGYDLWETMSEVSELRVSQWDDFDISEEDVNEDENEDALPVASPSSVLLCV